MKLIKNILLILMLLCNLNTVNAEPIDFDSVLKLSVQNSYALKLAKLDIDISQQDIKSARSEYFPMMQAYANTEYAKDLSDGTQGMTSVGNEVLLDSSRYQNTLSLGISYNLFDFGTRRKQLDRAKSNLDQKKVIYDQQLRDLEMTVLDIYTRVLSIYNEYKTKQEILKVQKELFELRDRLYTAGTSPRTHVLDEAIGVAELNIDIEKLKQSLNEVLKELAFYTMQEYSVENVEVNEFEQENIVPVAFKLEITHDDGLEYIPESRIYELEIDKKQKELEILNRQRLPKFNFYTNYYFYGSDPSNIFRSYSTVEDRSWTFRIATSVPIFDGFKNKSEQEKLKLEIQKLKISKDERLARFEKAYQITQDNISSFKRQLEQNDESLGIVKEKLSMLEILDNERLIDKTEYLTGTIDLLSKKLDLEEARIKEQSELYKFNILNKYSNFEKAGQ